jgi:hypothetical protein
MAGNKFTEKAKSKLTAPTTPKSMGDLLGDQENTVDEPVKLPDVRKTLSIEHGLNEKLRLLVFQKKFASERAAFEEGLRLLFKRENI